MAENLKLVSDNPLSPMATCTGETDPATGAGVCAHDPGDNAWNEHPYYNVSNFQTQIDVCRTNTAPSTAMRAFGGAG